MSGSAGPGARARSSRADPAGADGDRERRPAGAPVDLRLLPAAAAAWAAAVQVVRLDARAAAFAGLAAVASALALTLLARREARPPHEARGGSPPPVAHRSGRSAALGAGALATSVAAAVLLAGAAQLHTRTAGLLGEALDLGSSVRLVGAVQAEPTLTAGSGEARMSVLVDVRTVSVGDRTERAAAPVLLLAPAVQLSVGSWVEVRGALAPGRSGARPVAVLRASDDVATLRGPSGPVAWAGRVRAAADAVVASLPGPAGALLPAMAWGSVDAVDQTLTDQMRAAGLSHLVAVSGAHFAIVTSLVLAGVGRWSWPRWARAGLVSTVGAALIVLVGPQPSVLRAAVMGAVGLGGLLAGRGSRGPAALAAAIVVLLVADPWLATEPGFLLSVLATAGLIGLGPVLMDRWSGRLGRGVAGALAAPVAGQLATAPVSASLSGGVAIWALPANLLVAPVVAPVTVLGLACALIAPVWPWAARAVAVVAGLGCTWVAWVARWAAGAPLSTVAWLPGAAGTALLATGCVACAVLLTRQRGGRERGGT